MATWFLPLITALLLHLSFPPAEINFLAFAAFIPLFFALSQNKSPKKRALLCFTAGIAFAAAHLYWLTSIYGPLGIAFILLLGFFWALFGYGSVYLSPGLWPFLWLAIEFLRSELLLPLSGYGALGYSQGTNLRMLQSASLAGVYGVGFLIFLVNVFIFKFIKKRSILNIVPAAAVIALMLLWGAVRLNRDIPEPDIPVAAVQSEKFSPENMYELSLKTMHHSPHIIAWPEYQVLVIPGQRREVYGKLKTYARSLGAYTVAGIVEFTGLEGDKFFDNYVLVFSPRGEIMGKYRKQRPAPVIEYAFRRGRFAGVFSTIDGNMATPICYDFNFSAVVRSMTSAGAEFFVLPAAMPEFTGNQAKVLLNEMAKFRAVESGRWVLKAASSGITSILDPRGRERASLAPGGEDFLTGRMGASDSITVYHRGGYIFPYLSFIIITAAVLLKGKKKEKPDKK